jgi:hypothetical protein
MYDHYRCEVCNHPLDPKGESTAELVSTWVIKGKSVKRIQRTYRFAHKVCIEYEPKDDSQPGLFS